MSGKEGNTRKVRRRVWWVKDLDAVETSRVASCSSATRCGKLNLERAGTPGWSKLIADDRGR